MERLWPLAPAGGAPFVHRSKALVLAAAFAATLACKKDPTVVSRAVTAHVPSACPTPADAFAEYFATGDFQAQEEASGSISGADLAALPLSSQALFIQVTGDAATPWWGRSTVPPAGPVDVLLLPAKSPCALSTDVEPRMGAAIGPTGDGRVLVVGGAPPPAPDETTPLSFIADLTTSEVTALADGLGTPRTHPSVTPFGQGALVAGGTSQGGATLSTAEVFTGRDFDSAATINIAPRAEHGAVVLATGETLLVGGTDGNSPLATLEMVDPKTRAAVSAGLEMLDTARTGPNVARLASGEILVQGGLAEGSSGTALVPVGTLEWLTPDARSHSSKADQTIEARQRSALVALPAGGALVVLLPDPTDTGPFQNVWVIGADGTPVAAAPLSIPPSDAGQPFLFGSAEGKPILWTGADWLQWDPWGDVFVPIADGAAGPTDEATSPDPALAMWLDHGATSLSPVHLTGLRFSSHGEYDSFAASLLTNDTSSVAPDRFVAPGVIDFNPAPAGLRLAPGASVFVTDTTYAAVTLSFQAPTGVPPLVVLRDAAGDELEIGGSSCPFAPGTAELHVERVGTKVTVDGASCTTGAIGESRVSLGLRGAPSTANPPAVSVAVNLGIVRQ